MKKWILITLISLNISGIAMAQSEKYYGAMGATLQQFSAAKTPQELNELSAKFARIAEAEKNQFLPYYYAALVKAQMAMSAKGSEADKLAEEAQQLTDKAAAIDDNSELDCIKNMIATARMLVDPMNRWQQYGPIAQQHLQSAMKKDAANPRPYMLMAASLSNTPEQFGGGCKTAKPIAEKAVSLYAAFKPVSALHPTWGKEMAESIAKKCQ